MLLVKIPLSEFNFLMLFLLLGHDFSLNLYKYTSFDFHFIGIVREINLPSMRFQIVIQITTSIAKRYITSFQIFLFGIRENIKFAF